MQVLTITGNLGRDGELRQTQGGDQVFSFSVAVKQGFDRDAATVWYRCSVWGKRGETLSKYLRKGTRVNVVGNLTIGEYQGKPQYDLRVMECDFENKGEQREEPRRSGGGETHHQRYDDDSLDQDVPFLSCWPIGDHRNI